MDEPLYPSLYQINTRVWLTELSRPLGRPATLDDIPDAELDSHRRDGIRLGLAPERLANGARRAARVARPIRSGARSSRRRCRICARRTSPAPASRSPATPSIPTLGGDAALARLRERLRAARAAADARLRPQPHRAGSSLGGGSSRVLHRRDGDRSGAGAAELHAGQADGGRPAAGPWPRSVLSRLAGHAAARLQQSRPRRKR